MITILGLHWTHFIAALLACVVAYLVYYGNKLTAENRVEDIKAHTSSNIDSSVKSINTHTTSALEKSNKNDELIKVSLSDIKLMVEEIKDIAKTKDKKDEAQINKILNKIDKLENLNSIANDLNVKLPDTLLLEEKRQFLKREIKKLIEGDLTFFENSKNKRKQSIEEKNRIAYPFISSFFKKWRMKF